MHKMQSITFAYIVDLLGAVEDFVLRVDNGTVTIDNTVSVDMVAVGLLSEFVDNGAVAVDLSNSVAPSRGLALPIDERRGPVLAGHGRAAGAVDVNVVGDCRHCDSSQGRKDGKSNWLCCWLYVWYNVVSRLFTNRLKSINCCKEVLVSTVGEQSGC